MSWVLIRATCDLSEGGERLHRDQTALVDPRWPRVQQLLAAGLIVPLPADQQPTDPVPEEGTS
jgi:hypothetical protein